MLQFVNIIYLSQGNFLMQLNKGVTRIRGGVLMN